MNWSASEWLNEMGSVARLAAMEAADTYDPDRGAFDRFVASRVFARTLTYYRREWAYATRHVESGTVPGCSWAVPARVTEPADPQSATAMVSVHEVLGALAEKDRWLLEQVYGRERTEADVARQLGISQRAVNKRKQALLRRLRSQFEH